MSILYHISSGLFEIVYDVGVAILNKNIGEAISAFNNVGSVGKVIPSILETVDHTLIAITIFLIGFLLISIINRMRYSHFVDYSMEIDELFALVLVDLKEAMCDIDKLVLSMTTITLVMAFLIYILREKHSSLGIGVCYMGLSIGVVILAIAIYLYLTHRNENNTQQGSGRL